MSRKLLGAVAPVLVLVLASPALATDFDGDGREDIAFHRPNSAATTVPTLLSNGNGSWRAQTAAAPSWASQPGVVAVVGDYNGDRRSDVAFYRPGSNWNTVPVLLANGAGGWTAYNSSAPAWANQPGVVAVAGDYNNDGRTDLAFLRPGGGWQSVPILRANGAGAWTAYNSSAPSWAAEPGVVGVAGDFNGDRYADIAFHRPGGGWQSVSVLLGDGNGTWTARVSPTQDWANQPGVIAIPGDYNGDGKTDLAFHRPDGTWNSVPVLMSIPGGFNSTNVTEPGFANQLGAIAVPGDYNGDGKTDLAFHRPDGTWNSVPVLLSRGSGSWTPTNFVAPAWANQPGVIAVPGDYDGDRKTDLAFHRPDGVWNSTPVLFANGDGSWRSTNYLTPSWVAQSGTVAIQPPRRAVRLALPASTTDGGDPGYDETQAQSDAWRRSFNAWIDALRLILQLSVGYEEYVRRSGLNGRYDGAITNGTSSADAYLEIEQQNGEVRGRIILRTPTLRLNGGICSDVVVPVSVLPIRALSPGLYTAHGDSRRNVDMLGGVSGDVDVSFDLSLETTSYRVLTGSLAIDAPWPCSDQGLTFRFQRRPL